MVSPKYLQNSRPLSMLWQLMTAPAKVLLTDTVSLNDFAQARCYSGRAAVRANLVTFFQETFNGSRSIELALTESRVGCLELTLHGRHRQRFMGIAPTGRELTLPMVIIGHIASQQLNHVSLYYDAGALLRQLDLS